MKDENKFWLATLAILIGRKVSKSQEIPLLPVALNSEYFIGCLCCHRKGLSRTPGTKYWEAKKTYLEFLGNLLCGTKRFKPGQFEQSL